MSGNNKDGQDFGPQFPDSPDELGTGHILFMCFTALQSIGRILAELSSREEREEVLSLGTHRPEDS